MCCYLITGTTGIWTPSYLKSLPRTNGVLPHFTHSLVLISRALQQKCQQTQKCKATRLGGVSAIEHLFIGPVSYPLGYSIITRLTHESYGCMARFLMDQGQKWHPYYSIVLCKDWKQAGFIPICKPRLSQFPVAKLGDSDAVGSRLTMFSLFTSDISFNTQWSRGHRVILATQKLKSVAPWVLVRVGSKHNQDYFLEDAVPAVQAFLAKQIFQTPFHLQQPSTQGYHRCCARMSEPALKPL